jgi:16S rRNA (uracil1498-N3)-methyltransferase
MLKGQYRFLAANSEEITVSTSNVSLTPSDNHKLINVLRADIGMQLNIICRSTGKVFLARLCSTNPEVKIEILSLISTTTPSRHAHRALMALCKGEKNDFICQKATELGVDHLCFFQAERSISRIGEQDRKKKLERWQKISAAALQQSGQSNMPSIEIFTSLNQALHAIPERECVLFGMQSGKNLLEAELPTGPVSFIIGPEGGLSPKENELLELHGAIPVTLGPATLRAETAFILTLGCLNLRLQQIQ